MSEEATLDDFTEKLNQEQASDELKQEQFGPFTLSTPGGWTAKRLGDIKRLITRGKQPTYADDGVPVINQECIYWNGWQFENLRYLEEEVAKDWKDKYYPQSGDVILNSTGQGTLGRAQVYPDNEHRAIDSHVTLLRTDEELNPYFHRYFLESRLGQALLYSMCVNGSTGQIELSKTRLDLLPIPIPPLSEQRKIATVLNNVDQAIQKKEEIIEQINTVQRGLLRSLFRKGGTRQDTEIETKIVRLGPKQFKVPVTWEVTDISSIGEVVTGDTPSTNSQDNFGGDFPFVTPDTLSYGKYVTMSERTLSETGRKEAKPIPEGSVMMECIGNIDKVAISNREVATNQQINSVIVTDTSYSNEFLYYHLQLLKDFIKSQAGKTAVPIVNKSSFEAFQILQPPIEEQREIVNILSEYDKGKQINTKCLTILNCLKKGLQQDLLSGSVRTTDTNIEVPDEIAQHG